MLEVVLIVLLIVLLLGRPISWGPSEPVGFVLTLLLLVLLIGLILSVVGFGHIGFVR